MSSIEEITKELVSIEESERLSKAASFVLKEFFQKDIHRNNSEPTTIWITDNNDLKDLCYTLHDGNLPNDIIYDYIIEALQNLADETDIDEIEPEIYTHNLKNWFCEFNDAQSFCDEWIENFGKIETTDNLLSGGNLLYKQWMYNEAADWIQSNIIDNIEKE